MKDVNDKQIGGTHYREQGIQVWDYVIANNLGYLEGNIVKYVSRVKGDRLTDLKKAAHYLEKLIEVEQHGTLLSEGSSAFPAETDKPKTIYTTEEQLLADIDRNSQAERRLKAARLGGPLA